MKQIEPFCIQSLCYTSGILFNEAPPTTMTKQISSELCLIYNYTKEILIRFYKCRGITVALEVFRLVWVLLPLWTLFVSTLVSNIIKFGICTLV